MRINNPKHIIHSENTKYNFMLLETRIGINNTFFVNLLIYYLFKEYSKYMSLLQIIKKIVLINRNKQKFFLLNVNFNIFEIINLIF